MKILYTIDKKFRPQCFKNDYNKKHCKKCPWKKKCKKRESFDTLVGRIYGKRLWDSMQCTPNVMSAIPRMGEKDGAGRDNNQDI